MIQTISKILPVPSQSNFAKTLKQERKLKKKNGKAIDASGLSFAEHMESMYNFLKEEVLNI